MMKSVLTLWISMALITIQCYAKEYKSMEIYQIETGKMELSRTDWLKSDRINRTYQWVKSCKFNFSYDGGFVHYTSIEQRKDFYLWLGEHLRALDIEIKWVDATAVMQEMLMKWKGKLTNEDLHKFAVNISKTVFDSAFGRLQDAVNRPLPVKGEDARIWDKKMFEFEHKNFYQYYLNRLRPDALEKLNDFMQRKGFGFFRVPVELEFPGRFEDLNQRLYWCENILVPFSQGDPIDRSEFRKSKKVAEAEKRVRKKEKKKKMEMKDLKAQPASKKKPE